MEWSIFVARGLLKYNILLCIELLYLLLKTKTKRTCNNKQKALLNNIEAGGATTSSVLHAYETLNISKGWERHGGGALQFTLFCMLLSMGS